MAHDPAPRWQLGLAVAALAVVAACSGGSDAARPTTATSATEAPSAPSAFPSSTAPLPKPGEPLADGTHAAYIRRVGDAELDVDVIQFLTGDAADTEARARGSEIGAADDYVIRNTSTELRTLPVAEGAAVTLAWDPDGARPPRQHVATYADLAAAVERHEDPFWLTVEDGVVTAIGEQYVP